MARQGGQPNGCNGAVIDNPQTEAAWSATGRARTTGDEKMTEVQRRALLDGDASIAGFGQSVWSDDASFVPVTANSGYGP